MKGQITLLGTGASAGVPVIGCTCEVCLSKDPCNQRFRSSALLDIDGKKILVDAGPDFRSQALRFGINRLDAFLITHTHFDHIAGIDDLKIFSYRQQCMLPCLASEVSCTELTKQYEYLFRAAAAHHVTRIGLCPLPMERGVIEFLGLSLRYMTYYQGKTAVTGFRFGSIAYITDICDYPPTIFEDLSGVDILILSALRHAESRMHFNIDQAVAFARQCNAKKTYLIHLAHELDFEKTNRELPSNIQLAYDGLTLDFTM